MRRLLLCGCLAAQALAEEPRRPDVFHLVTGQFPRHGLGYFEIRVIRLEAALRRNSADLASRLELAQARLELGHLDEAERAADSIGGFDPEFPGLEWTRAMIAKRRGDFAGALARVERAARTPEEVFERRALEWRCGAARRTFLGERYEEWPRAGTMEEADYATLLRFIESDPDFPDAYVVLGDELSRRRAGNLAVWSWVRALQLGHSAVEEIHRRIEIACFHFLPSNGRDPRGVVGTIEGILQRLETTEKLAVGFARTEYLLALSGDVRDVWEVEAEAVKRGYRRLPPGDFDRVCVTPAELVAAAPGGPGRPGKAGRLIRPPVVVPATWIGLIWSGLFLLVALMALAVLRRTPPWTPPRRRPLTVLG